MSEIYHQGAHGGRLRSRKLYVWCGTPDGKVRHIAEQPLAGIKPHPICHSPVARGRCTEPSVMGRPPCKTCLVVAKKEGVVLL